jgi:hypothetical protein
MGQELSGGYSLSLLVPLSKVFPISVLIPCFGEYSPFIPMDPHSFCGDPSTLKILSNKKIVNLNYGTK